MDVYYHPYQSHETNPGKKHFLEFLVIFIAVMVGFFAENLREKNTGKTNEYALSLYDDLKVDTAMIQRIYHEKNWIGAKYDSAEIMLESADFYRNNEFIYYADKYLSYNDAFISQDATYQQLCSIDNFRYIKNTDLTRKIINYYHLYSLYESIDRGFTSLDYAEQDRIEARLFNVRDLTSLINYKSVNFYNLVFRPVTKLKSIYRDPESLKLLYLRIDHAKNQSLSIEIYLIRLKRSASDILNDLRKAYKLK